MQKTYSKKFLPLPEQIQLLKTRGLTFLDEDRASVTLIRKNYFDVINGFETLLLKDPKAKKKKFSDGTSFEHFDELYNFDKKLSALVFKAIDSFENRLKTAIAYRFAEDVFTSNPKADPACYSDILMYENPFSIHNRLNNLTPGTATSPETTVNDLNYIINKFINKEIGNIQKKITELNRTSVDFISTKARTRLFKAKESLNNAIADMHVVINGANRLISTLPSTHTGTLILTISLLSNTLTTPFTKVTAGNPSKIETDIRNFLDNVQDLKIRVNKINSQVAPNSNKAIHTEPNLDLTNFVGHYLFKTNYGKNNDNYIDYVKSKYSYLQTYEIPPFWVIIKTLELGSVFRLMYGLKSTVLDNVVVDMGLLPTEKHLLFNSTKIINDFRNHCAHFGLVNRYRTKENIRINKDLINKLGLKTKSDGTSHYEIRLYDTLLVLAQFTSLVEISDFFKDFFMSPECIVNSKLLMKLLNRMGNDNFLNWCDL